MLRNQRGMTLIEIMIVIAILAGLMALLAPRVTENLNKAKIKQAKLQMGEVGKALDMYYTDCGQYPTSEQGLNALLEAPSSGCNGWGPDPYIKKNLLKDPWNHEFIYEENGGQYILRSLGKDGKEGGTGINADLSNQEEEQEK